MMKKQFVTYEIALKLKELGFNKECLGKWSTNGNLHTMHYGTSGFINDKGLTYIQAPLWQQAIDWLRTERKIHIEVYSWNTENILYEPSIRKIIDGEWEDLYPSFESEEDFATAREQAILKALELIKKIE